MTAVLIYKMMVKNIHILIGMELDGKVFSLEYEEVQHITASEPASNITYYNGVANYIR